MQFHDSWKSLCDWLDAQDHKLHQSTTNTARMKQELEELQVFTARSSFDIDLPFSVHISYFAVPSVL